MIPDEDANLRQHLAAAFSSEALVELRRVLEAPSGYRTDLLRALTARPSYADEVVRLRLLRAIRDARL